MIANRRDCSSRGFWLLLGLLLLPATALRAAETNKEPKVERWFHYTNDVIDDIPWSIHVVKLERASQEYEFVTTSGHGRLMGMGVVSEQVKSLPREVGQPMAAINGDFYEKYEKYLGRPRDLQIRQGEVLSAPAGHTCFWIDQTGQPHMTNLYSRFQVVWPNGKATPLGLNEPREAATVVLYTSVVGNSTRTTGGIELILESTNGTACLPLEIGQTNSVRIREVRRSGDSPLLPGTMVLSIGPALTASLPGLEPGAHLSVCTETIPALSGVKMAIGGGPALVRDGKPMHWSGFIHMRHPRAAIGWNKDYFFMVEVDGRQGNISLGMTFPEMADYLVKIGCDQAMNFDGGGSATLWALGSVRNSPSEGDERPSANALVVVRKKQGTN